MNSNSLPQPWHGDTDSALATLGVDMQRGLSDADVVSRRHDHGLNQLRSIKRKNPFIIFLDQFRTIVIWLLVAASAVTLFFGDLVETLAIAVVILINTGIGFFTELRAVRSIEALRKLGRVETTVRRNGTSQLVPAEMLVPGDIVLLEGGDIITADMRVVEAAKLAADESTLTGESLPVKKVTKSLAVETHLAERTNMLFKGTSITRGSGIAVVTSTGLDTELGKISELVLESEGEDTPLEKRLDALARRLVWVTAGIALLVGIFGIVGGRDITLAIEVAIALAVAAIPEGLPIVATIALARGMWRMARRNALIAKLSAVETLGATSVILTDKTGTLTENRITLTKIVVADGTFSLSGIGFALAGTLTLNDKTVDPTDAVLVHELLTQAALCNNATLSPAAGTDTATAVGDPTEVALLVAAAKLGISRPDLLRSYPEVSEEPFDPETRAMATFHRDGQWQLVAAKGAPEAILDHCTAVRSRDGDIELDAAGRSAWLEKSADLGRQGLRTLAIATKRVDGVAGPPYANLILLGLVGAHDPPRPGVREAIAACRAAGITVVMVTGDHAATARSVAEDLGLLAADSTASDVLDGRRLVDIEKLSGEQRQAFADARVIARASPEQKLNLIAMHQERGHVVAMTGDGVNDAPALKKADIGVAMGLRGTQVAKESAAMILQDDRFETIVEAVAQGRAIYINIRKFVVYLMSCNISEILVVGLATLVNAPLPLLPLQILFLNLVTDIFPALALGVGEGPPALMSQRPRAVNESLLTPSHWRVIFIYGVVLCLSVLAAMAIAIFVLDYDSERAVTVSFLTLALGQLWHVFNLREDPHRWFRNEITANPWIWAAIALCLVLILGAVFVPGLSSVLSLANPGWRGWAVILIMSALPLALAPLILRPNHQQR